MTVAAMECLELESLLEERLGGSTSSLADVLQGLSAVSVCIWMKGQSKLLFRL